jgi:uncharacterized protein (TIGR03067 family)
MGVQVFLALAAALPVLAGPPHRGAARAEMSRLAGTWELVSETVDGERTDLTGLQAELVFRGNRVTDRLNGRVFFRTGYRLMPGYDPKGLDVMERDGVQVANEAVYSLARGRLTIAFFRGDGKARPKDFKPEPGDDKVVRVYRRKQP